jgi:hypothetical protein
MIAYTEQDDDGDDQYSEDTDANKEKNLNMEYKNESHEASDDIQNKSNTNSARADSDVQKYNKDVSEYHEGVASIKVQDSRSNIFRRVALDFQDCEPSLINEHSTVVPSHHTFQRLRVHR